MAQRKKKTTRKKAARGATTRKAPARRKATKSKATKRSAKKKTATKRSTKAPARAARKKPARKKATARKRGAAKSAATPATPIKRAGQAIARLESELPRNLRDYLRELRRRLDVLEREIQRMQSNTRKRATSLLREASVQLGALEAMGQWAWQRLTTPSRREAAQLLRRLESAIAPPSTSKTSRARAKSRRKKS